MLSHAQVDKLFALRNDRTSFFSLLPPDVADVISCVDYDTNPNSEIGIALRHAATCEKADRDVLVEMVKANPRLLLQAGDVKTRGGVLVKRIKLYEFFLGEGDPDGANQIAFGFQNIVTGKEEREHQSERYRAHIAALANKIKKKQPTFDLRPLIKALKDSTDEEITDALHTNDPNRTKTCKTPLHQAFTKFKRAIKPNIKTSGEMHYEHYTTLKQAFDLLYVEWETLSDNRTNYAKCQFVMCEVIGSLQRSLPAVDRLGFARAFSATQRPTNGGDDLAGVVFYEAALHAGDRSGGRLNLRLFTLTEYLADKHFRLAELLPQRPPAHRTGCVVC